MAPSNALCIVQSEISLLSTALRCHTRITFRGHQEEIRSPLYKSFLQLKAILNGVSSLSEIEPLVYLTPFLEVIRSEDTTGPITGLALTAVDKFLSYGLLELPDPNYVHLPSSGPGSIKSIAIAVEAIADSGTQARFVGTERSSDEVTAPKELTNTTEENRVQEQPPTTNPPVQSDLNTDASVTQPQPYGLPAVHDLLHYLISLLTPERNSDGIISVSLGLVTIALETGADAISHCPSLLQLVQGDLAKHLLLTLFPNVVV
ncbi:unnamed protein product [Echinostoma caproni]|uniref:DUF913 domain-containing protein n=1 Tax=Echinostoma caproni TaxID=27848 RepID=A0A183B109_9TREM|nr:unnamed protein product [Echinostoma caproni]